MADDLELALRVRADVKKALSELNKLEKELREQKGAADTAGKSHERLAKNIDKSSKSAKQSSAGVNALGGAYRALTGAVGAYLGVQTLVAGLRLADQAKQLEARVRLATKAQGDFNQVWAELGDIAVDNGARLNDTVDLFTGNNRAAPEIGATRNQVLEVTNAVQQLGAISGATGTQMSNAMLQFSQAMAGGVVRAEEMNSIIENTPAIAEAIARGMGTTVGQLRRAVAEGKVLSKEVFDALLKQAPQIAQDFKDVPDSLDRAAASFSVNIQRMALELDRSVGLTEAIATALRASGKLAGRIADAVADSNGDESKLLDLQRERLSLFQQQRKLLEDIAAAQELVDRGGIGKRRLENYKEQLQTVKQMLLDNEALLAIENQRRLAKSEAENENQDTGQDGAPEPPEGGIPKTLNEAIAAQSNANQAIASLLSQRQSLVDSLDALSERLSGPASIEDQSPSANIFTLNRLRDNASDKADDGDVKGALSDLERAQQILENLSSAGEISKGYAQSQIQLIKDQIDKIGDVSLEVPVSIGGEKGEAERQQQWARIKAEFEQQQKDLPKLEVEIDENGMVTEAQQARKRLEQIMASVISVPVQITPQLAGAEVSRVPIEIKTNTGSVKAEAEGTEADVRETLSRAADEGGGR